LLTGIRKAPRGVPQIEVEFDMDANGILNVSAKDLNTGQEQAIRIETTGGLSEDELLQMEDDAQQASTDAQTRKRLMESRNRAERAIFDARKLLDSSGNSMSDEYREKIVRAVGAAEAALQGEDAFAIREAADELAEVRENIGQ
jgi:molecular chaperone DnaK